MAGRCPFSGAPRRLFLLGAGSTLAAAPAALAQSAAKERPEAAIESFWGARQGGILTPPQRHTYFAAFDIATAKRDELIPLFRRWTAASARLCEGRIAAPLPADPSQPGGDSLDALGLPPARLTLTFGFGPGLFARDGKDVLGLARHRPEALVDMPLFNGDQMVPARTGGDFSVQACADDPQVAFHAVRQLASLAYGVARLRWVQAGFAANSATDETPRNLMGFRDGTETPLAKGADGAEDRGGILWVRDEGPDWMRGGSYLVARRIRISLEHWDRTDVAFQQQVIGRRKLSGAPLTGNSEFDPLDLDAMDGDGNPVIPENAHVRLATAATNGGAQIVRRGYAYNDGVSFTAERWPPWRQGMLYDAGLLFICYQRDPRQGFIRIFEKMAKLDALNQFATHTGGGLFAVPPGTEEGSYIGQALFES